MNNQNKMKEIIANGIKLKVFFKIARTLSSELCKKNTDENSIAKPGIYSLLATAQEDKSVLVSVMLLGATVISFSAGEKQIDAEDIFDILCELISDEHFCNQIMPVLEKLG